MLSTFQTYSGGAMSANTLRGESGLLKLDHFSLEIYLKNKEISPRTEHEELATQSVAEARALLLELGYAMFADEEAEETEEAVIEPEEEPTTEEVDEHEEQLKRDDAEVAAELAAITSRTLNIE